MLPLVLLLGGCMVARDYIVSDEDLTRVYEMSPSQAATFRVRAERAEFRGTAVFVDGGAIRAGERRGNNVGLGRALIRTHVASRHQGVVSALIVVGGAFAVVGTSLLAIPSSEAADEGHCGSNLPCGTVQTFFGGAFTLVGGGLLAASTLVGIAEVLGHPAEVRPPRAPPRVPVMDVPFRPPSTRHGPAVPSSTWPPPPPDLDGDHW